MPNRVSIPLNCSLTTLKIVKPSRFSCLRCNRPLYFNCPSEQYRVSTSSWRPFSTTPLYRKKTGKANRAQARTDSSPPIDVVATNTPVDDAFDFSGLQAKILKATEHLAHELAQLRAGGRFNPDKLEDLRVQLKASKDGEKPRTVKLKDLAQVVAKGRTVSVICHEADQVKQIKSTILASNLNLSPRDPTEETPTTLQIQIPPPTRESRQQALASASKSADEALGRIREARGGHQKKLRSMQVAKKVRPDDLQKAQQQMEGVVKSGNEEIKKILENSRRVLEG